MKLTKKKIINKKNLKKYDEKFNGIDVWVEALHQ